MSEGLSRRPYGTIKARPALNRGPAPHDDLHVTPEEHEKAHQPVPIEAGHPLRVRRSLGLQSVMSRMRRDGVQALTKLTCDGILAFGRVNHLHAPPTSPPRRPSFL